MVTQNTPLPLGVKGDSGSVPISPSTPTGTDTPTTPEPQDPDDTISLRIGRIDLTQFRPGQSYRRVRICDQHVSKSDRSATQNERATFSSL